MGRLKGKITWILAFSFVLIMGLTLNAAAAGSISSIRITLTNRYETGTVLEPEFSTGGGYSFDSVAWSKDIEKWTPGKKVTAEIYLTADTGYSFKDNYTRSNVSIYGGTYSSAKVLDEGTAVIKVSYVPVVQLGQPESAGWSDTTKTKATWKKVPYATTYQVRLYKNDDRINTQTVTGTSVDLSEYMRSEDYYYYEVRAIGKNGSERNYLKDGEFTTSTDNILENLGDTTGSWSKSQAGNRYRDENGNYVTNSWKMIFGKWYYFNNGGYAATGWQYLNNQWYYLDGEGVMQTGWLLVNDRWYFMNENGDMATGWIQTQPGKWYYLDSSGAMQTGWINVGGKWYYLDPTGLMLSNTTVDGAQLGPDGARR